MRCRCMGGVLRCFLNLQSDMLGILTDRRVLVNELSRIIGAGEWLEEYGRVQGG